MTLYYLCCILIGLLSLIAAILVMIGGAKKDGDTSVFSVTLANFTKPLRSGKPGHLIAYWGIPLVITIGFSLVGGIAWMAACVAGVQANRKRTDLAALTS